MSDARPSAAPDAGQLRTGAILFLVCAAQFMVILDVSVVNVALPAVRSALGFSETGLQWVVSAYTLTFGGLLLLGGRAGDLLGRKRMFIVGIVVFSLASLAGGLAQSQAMLVAARALQGVGGAIVAPATLAILTTTFREGPERARAFAAWGAVAAAGGSAGGLVGGVLTELLSWRWILFVNLPIGVAIVWLALRDLQPDRVEDKAAARDFDLTGALTITLGVSALVYGIVRSESIGWGATGTTAPIAVGIVLIVLFVLVEARLAKAPLMPLSIFASRQLTAANLAVFLLGASMFAMWFFLSLYLQQVLGLTAIQTGVAFLPQTAVMALGSTQAAKVVAKLGIRTTLTVGFLLSAIGLAWLTQIDADGSFWVDVLGPSVVLAAGMGLCMVPITTAAVTGVDGRQAGLASGLVNVSRQVGGALGLAILASIASSRTADSLAGAGAQPSAAALADGYAHAFVFASAFALAGALVVFALVRTEPGGPRPADAPRPVAAGAAD
ncbi:MFS transporter [Patulibacter americanus]|uniref:MFS transporter n=1 Tax=Patulibacter americanus TaxID=588672 RepID=UPI0003B4E320|nr:MFS transporter [Patulibacter americanus]